jgi:hypothetical protein
MTSFKRGAAVDVDPVVLAVEGVGGGGTDGTVIVVECKEAFPGD